MKLCVCAHKESVSAKTTEKQGRPNTKDEETFVPEDTFGFDPKNDEREKKLPFFALQN